MANPSDVGPGGALSLAGLEFLSPREQSARINAVVNDIYASIIYISKQSKLGNLTDEQCTPIYDLIDNIMVVERKKQHTLQRELKRQDARMARIAARHLNDIKKLVRLAMKGMIQLRRKAARLQRELDELKGRRRIELGDVASVLPKIEPVVEAGDVVMEEAESQGSEVTGGEVEKPGLMGNEDKDPDSNNLENTGLEHKQRSVEENA